MNIPKRKSMRYKGFDYSQYGSYFLTICTRNKEKLFWNMEKIYTTKQRNELEHIINPESLPLTDVGKIIEKNIALWNSIYENVEILTYVIMPDHIHLIVSIMVNENKIAEKNPNVSQMVAQFKARVTKDLGESIWQKSYYDHIIVNEKDFNDCFDYIESNPYALEARILEQRKNFNK